MTWKGHPKSGTSWRGRNQSVDGRRLIETRHVIDRTLGGYVIYVQGRLTRFATHHTITIENWNAWVRRAGAAMTAGDRK